MRDKKPPFKFDPPKRNTEGDGNPLVLYVCVVIGCIGLYTLAVVLWGAW